MTRMDSFESSVATSSSQLRPDMDSVHGAAVTAGQFDTKLSVNSRQCIERLLVHHAEQADLTNIHHKKQAAVLILLFEKAGNLRVLLTTRSKNLRAHPGQTALPGGKMDDTDKDAIETAYREAHEEVGLPRDSPDVHTLSLLTNLGVLNHLAPSVGEVDVIFDHPLEAILDPTLSAPESLVELNSEHWPYDTEYHNFTDREVPWLQNSTYRMHRFRSSASPIKGLTAEILIAAAIVAYDRPPTYYSHFAPGQLTSFSAVLRALAVVDSAGALTDTTASGKAAQA